MIGRHIVSLISAHVAELRGQIFPIIAPQGAKYPYALYKRLATQVDYTKDGAASDTVSVQISVVSQNYLEADGIVDKVRAALEGVGGGYDDMTVDDAVVTNISDDYVVDQDCYVVSINMNFYITKN